LYCESISAPKLCIFVETTKKIGIFSTSATNTKPNLCSKALHSEATAEHYTAERQRALHSEALNRTASRFTISARVGHHWIARCTIIGTIVKLNIRQNVKTAKKMIALQKDSLLL
jgi:hypothetical protein